MIDFIEDYVNELLHCEETTKNKLVDLEAGDKSKTVYLSCKNREQTCAEMVQIISERTGLMGNTVLRGSAKLKNNEQIIGHGLNVFDWVSADGSHDSGKLHEMIEAVYKDLSTKGNNPLFLSVGTINWDIPVTKDEIKKVRTPILIYPIRLVRTGDTSPVSIEFVADDAYFNPCLDFMLRQVLGEKVADDFPHPSGDVDEPVNPTDAAILNGGYFYDVEEYVKKCRNFNANFEFDKNAVAISQYKHEDICMYYDIKRNRDKIVSHPLVNRMFKKNTGTPAIARLTKEPTFILETDSVQEGIIRRVVNGDSLIIKGPPGTGKTLTIANMIASLMAEGKKVLLMSAKTSALGEVYAKLPDALRKFALLLSYETESQAAKVNPSEIKKNMRSLIDGKKKYSYNTKADDEMTDGIRDKSAAITALSAYVTDTFDNDMLESSYYDALDVYCKNLGIAERDFAPLDKISSLSRDKYLSLVALVKEAEAFLDTLTAKDTHAAGLNPWFNMEPDCNADEAFEAYKRIAVIAQSLLDDMRGVTGEIDGGKLRLGTFATIARGGVDENIVIKIAADKKTADFRDELNEKALEYLKACELPRLRTDVALSEEKAAEFHLKLASVKADKGLSSADVRKVCSKADLFRRADGNNLSDEDYASIEKLSAEITGLEEKRSALLTAAYRVLPHDMTAEQRECCLQAYKELAEYENTPAEKPGTFDFGGKKYYKSVKAISYIEDATFKDIVAAVGNLSKAQEKETEINKIYNRLTAVFMRKEERENLEAIVEIARMAKRAGRSVPEYVEQAKQLEVILAEVRTELNVDGDFNIGELLNTLAVSAQAKILKSVIKRMFTGAGLNAEPDGYDLTTLARAMYAACDISACNIGQIETVAAVVGKMGMLGKGFVEKVKKWQDAICEFAVKYFTSSFSADPAGVNVSGLSVFIAEAPDRNSIAAVNGIRNKIRESERILSLKDFVEPFMFDKERREGKSLVEIFEHRFYAELLRFKKSRMGDRRNNVGGNVVFNLKKLDNAENKIRRANIARIEQGCMARINPESDMYAFLAQERVTGTLRKLFKDHGDAILSLKRCVILSPSTISLLFRPEIYENFDTVIIDEASQLKPVEIIPAMFRSKQCVIVGDEWQMPPITHFKPTMEKRVRTEDGTEEVLLEPDKSALSLALENEAFAAEELKCHYRSKTESLIAFSRDYFYEYMRTFPAPVPKADGLGFTDIFIDGATCSGGKNEKEAQEVVNQLKLHFEKYFDRETGKLSRSVGVVAFGQSQIDCIQRMVVKDSELSRMMGRALENFDDVPEKLIFFKTIETVQGQEIAHLILSVTYGRSEKGELRQHFGQLNRDKLGRCIFNVSVTRAQYEITVIHSIRASEIDNEHIDYIKKYLEISSRFSKDGKEQFVSIQPKDGFIRSVGEFIASLGISPERIVYDYGVTKGSVKIPVAVLSEDLTEAKVGIWCEKALGKDNNYIDYNMRYYGNLVARGWKLCRVYAHDWIDNAQAERNQLRSFVLSNLV